MELVVSISFAAIAIILCCIYHRILRWSTFEEGGHLYLRSHPGPPGWPSILGNLLALVRTPTCTTDRYRFSQWSRQYGDIYKITLGFKQMYVLSSMDLVRDAFGHSQIQGRPHVYHYRGAFGPRAGSVASSSGPEWTDLRRFIQSLFRDLGVGRELFACAIQSEITRLDAEFGSFTDETCWSVLELFNTATGNIICGITFGHQYDYGDDEGKKLRDMMIRLDKAVGTGGSVATSKFLCGLPFGPGKTLRNTMAEFKRYSQNRTAEVQSQMEVGDSPNNFVRAFLMEMGNGETHFCEETMVACCLDMLFAGTETTASTLAFTILLLTTHPSVQAKCQVELANFVKENGRLPSYSDRLRLPYTLAMIHESERFACVVPLGVPHMVEDDNVKLFGYDFPKGSLVVANFDFMNMDEKKFHRPYEFKPERFMSNGCFKPHPDIRPFSIGRRSCLGEPLARMELFLILTNLLHSFTFTAPANTKMPDPRVGVYGITRRPLPFGVDIKRREN